MIFVIYSWPVRPGDVAADPLQGRVGCAAARPRTDILLHSL